MTFALLCHFCVPKEEFLQQVSPCQCPLQIPGRHNFQTRDPAFIDVDGSFWNMSTDPVLHLPLERCDSFWLLTGVFKAGNMAADTGGWGGFKWKDCMSVQLLFLTTAPTSLTPDLNACSAWAEPAPPRLASWHPSNSLHVTPAQRWAQAQDGPVAKSASGYTLTPPLSNEQAADHVQLYFILLKRPGCKYEIKKNKDKHIILSI